MAGRVLYPQGRRAAAEVADKEARGRQFSMFCFGKVSLARACAGVAGAAWAAAGAAVVLSGGGPEAGSTWLAVDSNGVWGQGLMLGAATYSCTLSNGASLPPVVLVPVRHPKVQYEKFSRPLHLFWVVRGRYCKGVTDGLYMVVFLPSTTNVSDVIVLAWTKQYTRCPSPSPPLLGDCLALNNSDVSKCAVVRLRMRNVPTV